MGPLDKSKEIGPRKYVECLGHYGPIFGKSEEYALNLDPGP